MKFKNVGPKTLCRHRRIRNGPKWVAKADGNRAHSKKRSFRKDFMVKRHPVIIRVILVYFRNPNMHRKTWFTTRAGKCTRRRSAKCFRVLPVLVYLFTANVSDGWYVKLQLDNAIIFIRKVPGQAWRNSPWVRNFSYTFLFKPTSAA